MLKPGTAKLVDIGCDWMTLTTRDQMRGEEWKAEFSFVASLEQAKGYKWSDARLFGYVGEACGHAFWGKGINGFMVRLSSSCAQEHGLLFSPDAVHCTRIDFQATAELTYPDPGLLERVYNQAQEGTKLNGRPVRYTLIKDSGGGRTLYVGSRSSALFGRLYDKGVEEGTEAPGKLFRWELECKDYAADQAVAMILPSSQPEHAMLGYLGRFFTERSVPVVWSYIRPEENFVVPQVSHDDVGALRWLRGPVARTFARISMTVGKEVALRAIMGHILDESSDSEVIPAMVQNWEEHSLLSAKAGNIS
jgi:hypothetical protein